MAKVRCSLLMLEVVALGGLGEFGMNMLALSWGATTLVIDAGVMFPDPSFLASIESFRISPTCTRRDESLRWC